MCIHLHTSVQFTILERVNCFVGNFAVVLMPDVPNFAARFYIKSCTFCFTIGKPKTDEEVSKFQQHNNFLVLQCVPCRKFTELTICQCRKRKKMLLARVMYYLFGIDIGDNYTVSWIKFIL